ncbi:MFS transporter [Paenibacillus aceti]|uniref:MFS transporter n=1 Tax=Paenibacillus aceti TaxID=1820010 RepID=UPI000EA0AD24|nr:MFS transporter [Paenibacillus aceti]
MVKFRPSFYYLWSSQTLSNTVDVLYLVALTTYVLNQTGSIIFATLVPFFRVVAQMLSGLIAPLLIDRYRLTFLLTLAQGGQFLVFIALGLYLSPWISGADTMFIYVFIAGLSFLDGWTSPARNALIPRLVDDSGLMKANGLIGATDQIVQFAGWAISGVLVAAMGSFPVLVVVAVCYGIAAAITVLIEDPTEAKQRNLFDVRTSVTKVRELVGDKDGASSEASEEKELSRWEILKEGWVALWRVPRLRALTMMDICDALGGMVWVGAFILVFVQDVLHQDEKWWGYINASYFAGAVLGGFIVVALVKKFEKKVFLSMIVGMLGYGLLTAWFGLNQSTWLALVIVFLTGPFSELAAVTRRTLIQRSVNKDMLPKVFSAQSTLLSTLYGLSLLLMSGIAEWFGIVNMYLLAALISLITVVIGWANRKAIQL